MTKQSGLGDNLYVSGANLSGDIGAIGTAGGGPAPMDLTGIDKSAYERQGGLRDGRLEFSSFFNPTAGEAHDILSALPRADRVVSYWRGTVLGGETFHLVGKQIDYAPSRGADGSLTIATSAVANGFGAEWGNSLTAGVESMTATENGTGVDFAAETDFGLQAYLHVFEIVGNINATLTVKLQESDDNAVGDPYGDVTDGGFAIIDINNLPPTAERIETARDQTVKRWLRYVATAGGTFTSAEFAVAVVKNDVEVAF